jgi:hypothetical protein
MENDNIKSILLYRAADQLEATLLEVMLNESGVRAWTAGGQASSGFGELGADSLIVDIRVPEEKHAEGILLIKEYFAQKGTEGLSADGTEPTIWTCTKCGQTVGPTFTACWNCLTPR